MNIEDELIEIEIRRSLRKAFKGMIGLFIDMVNEDNKDYTLLAINIEEVDFVLGIKEEEDECE